MLRAAEQVWTELAESATMAPALFDSASLSELPGPGRRWFSRVLPPGTPLIDGIELKMTGELALRGRWFPFQAVQILRSGIGFVWSPVVGSGLLRFTGADVLGPDVARLEFRIHGLLPLVRASGPDIARSAAGRLAAETVAWLPQAVTPESGARWRGVDDERAVVTVDAGGESTDVELLVDRVGRLRKVALCRWSTDAKPPSYRAFGGQIDREYETPDGVQIAGRGCVGWDWGTPTHDRGVFFRYRITEARSLTSVAGP